MNSCYKYRSIPLLVFVLAAASCSEPESIDTGPAVAELVPGESERWYSESQVETGRAVFQENCSECHGELAEGIVSDWRSRLDDGSFPPPPLNGSAHAWHHPLPVLLQVINQGGIPLGGRMPAFATVLDDEQKLAAVAYFQSFWSDEIYQQWESMGGVN